MSLPHSTAAASSMPCEEPHLQATILNLKCKDAPTAAAAQSVQRKEVGCLHKQPAFNQTFHVFVLWENLAESQMNPVFSIRGKKCGCVYRVSPRRICYLGDMAHLNDQLLKGFRLVAMEAGSGLISKLVERHGMVPPYDHWRLGTCLPYNHLGEWHDMVATAAAVDMASPRRGLSK